MYWGRKTGENFMAGKRKLSTVCFEYSIVTGIVPTLFRHFVGVLNKTSGQMEVYDAELFNMQPLFSGRAQSGRLTKTLRVSGWLDEFVFGL